MRAFTRITLIVVSLLAFAVSGFAAEVKAPAKPAENAAKVDANAVEAKSAAKKLVDINSATDVELKAVPGIGDAYAAKIIAGRPYANKTQLKSRKIVPSVVYEQVKDLLIAKQPKK
jgi:DNA uptake protein ComE-like DNA-binding protein